MRITATKAFSSRAGRLDFDTIFPILYATVLMVVSFSVHLAYFPVGDVGVESDFYGDLVVAAKNLSRGLFSVTFYPYKGPAYSFALILIRFIVHDWYRSGVVLSVLCAGGALVISYRILVQLFYRKIAIVAVVAISLFSEFFNHSHKACSDMLFFLLCCSVVILLLGKSWSWWRIVVAAILGAIAFLTRYIGIFLLMGAVITFCMINPHQLIWRRRLAASSLFIIIHLAVCLPWFAMSYKETGTVIATRNVENIVEEFYGDKRKGEIPEDGFDSVRSVIAHDPLYFVGRILLNIPRHLWFDARKVLGIPYGILVFLGLIRLCLVYPTKRQGVFYLFAFCYFLPMCAVFHIPRFSLPILPAYAAVGFSALFGSSERVPHRSVLFGKIAVILNRNRMMAVLVISILFAYQIFWISKTEKTYYASRPLFVLNAAQFLKSQTVSRDKYESSVVMARKPHIPYYADMQYQPYPNLLLEQQEFITFAVEHNVDYLVYSYIEQRHYQRSSFFLSLDSTPGVTKIYNSKEAIIYKLASWMNLGTSAGKKALADFINRLDQAEAGGDMDEILSSYYVLVRFYGMNGKWDEMAEYLRRAIEFTETIEDKNAAERHKGAMTLNLAQAYMLGDRYADSIALLEGSIEGFSKPGYEQNLAASHILLSRNYWKNGRKAESVRHLKMARRIYDAIGDKVQVDKIEKRIDELERNM